MKIKLIVVLLGLLSAGFAFAMPDLAVQISLDNASPSGNESFEFTITVSNDGDSGAGSVTVINQLPADLEIPMGMAAFPSSGSYDPVSGEWFIGDILVGEMQVLVIPAMVASPNPADCIVNTATVDQIGDGNIENNEAIAIIYQNGVERCVDFSVNLSISAGDADFFFPECDLFGSYYGDIEVTNISLDSARNVSLSISQLPVVGKSIRFNDADCNNAPSAICEIGTLAPGETVTVDVTSDQFQNYSFATQTLDVMVVTSDFDYGSPDDGQDYEDFVQGFSSCDVPDISIGVPDFAGPGGCFIATAAYGSHLHPHLDSLRGFRDQVLLPTSIGQYLVEAYYRYSPPIADFIAERDWLRAVVRLLLTPIVYAVKYPIAAVLVCIAMFLIRRVRRRRLNCAA